MSWNFRKAGKDKMALKAAVQAESAPQAVKDEICARIEGCDLEKHYPGCAIVVETFGHLGSEPRPYNGLDMMVIKVQPVSYIDTRVGSGG
jgi:hypothetical protein